MAKNEVIILGAIATIVAIGVYFAYQGRCVKFKAPLGFEADVNC